ncbi:MAG: hypothetical protein WD118_08025 [Phycisphaeraceae bacterium]
MMVEMLLAEIRKEAGLTRIDLPEASGIKQPPPIAPRGRRAAKVGL